MARIKPKRHGVSMDMTAMCDVAFLLLTFFILTTQFRAQETVEIKTPSSIATQKLDEKNLMVVALDKDGNSFFGIKNDTDRASALTEIGTANGIAFTNAELAVFKGTEQFGLPIAQMKQYLALPKEKRALVKQTGIPNDSIKSELVAWALATAKVNPENKLAIKGDVKSNYKAFKDVIKNMQKSDINKFKLITNSESKPQ